MSNGNMMQAALLIGIIGGKQPKCVVMTQNPDTHADVAKCEIVSAMAR